MRLFSEGLPIEVNEHIHFHIIRYNSWIFNGMHLALDMHTARHGTSRPFIGPEATGNLSNSAPPPKKKKKNIKIGLLFSYIC